MITFRDVTTLGVERTQALTYFLTTRVECGRVGDVVDAVEADSVFPGSDRI